MAVTADTPLSIKQQAFADYYIESCNATQSAIKAGYSEKTATQTASRLLTYVNIRAYIEREKNNIHANTIANARQVMEFFTRVMNGEEKDQFGLDASIADRTRAAQELAKRTIDIDNKLAGKSANDATIKIEVDWTRPEEKQKEE